MKMILFSRIENPIATKAELATTNFLSKQKIEPTGFPQERVFEKRLLTLNKHTREPNSSSFGMHSASAISYPPSEPNCGGNHYARLGQFAPLRRQCFESAYQNPCTGNPPPGSQLFVPSSSSDPRAYLSDVRPHFGNVTEEFPGVSCRWTQATRANAIYPNECPSGRIENGYCVATNTAAYEFETDNPRVVRPMSQQEVLEMFPMEQRELALYYMYILSRGIAPRLYLVEAYDWTTGADRRAKIRTPAIVISTPVQARIGCRRSMASLWRGKVLSLQAAGDVEEARKALEYEGAFLYQVVLPDGTLEEMMVAVRLDTMAAAKLALSQLQGKCA